eukprot:2386011-Pleurochrysis_carterae.AAC.1
MTGCQKLVFLRLGIPHRAKDTQHIRVSLIRVQRSDDRPHVAILRVAMVLRLEVGSVSAHICHVARWVRYTFLQSKLEEHMRNVTCQKGH